MNQIIKTIFFLTILLWIAQPSFGQGLKEIFVNIPSGLGVSKEQRLKMVNQYIDNNEDTDTDYLAVFDPRNGFLVINGPYEGATSLTYWNISNGDKLIGIVDQSCGGACICEILFWQLSEGVYKELEHEKVLPKISISDFFDTELMKSDGLDIIKDVQNYGPNYYLPSNGKNIRVKHQIELLNGQTNKYERYQEIKLLWNDGSFLKSN